MYPDRTEVALRKLVASLARKGYLHRLKRDLYYVTPDRVMDPDQLIKVGPLIYKGYVAFSSALYIHGLLDYHPFTIFVATVDIARTLEVDNYEIKFVTLGERFDGMTLKDEIWVSDMEKTIFDCFFKLDHAGGMPNIVKALAQIRTLEWPRFMRYVERYARMPMRQRIGFILDVMLEKDLMEVPEYVVEELSKDIKYPARLDPSEAGIGTYSRKWKLIDNIGEGTYLGWM